MTDEATSPPPFAAAQVPRVPTARRYASLRSIVALMMREMATSYGKSPGGYIWALLEPLATIAVLSVAFSVIFRQPSIGTSFILFYASGMMPFTMFSTVSQKLAQSFSFSRQLLTYPAVSFIDALLARVAVTLLTQVMVGFVVFTAILTLADTRSVPNLPLILMSYGLAVLFGIGVGMVNAFLMTRFPIWVVAWSVATRPLFLISGILFIFNGLPQELQRFIWYNPLIHIVGTMRAGFYPTYKWDYVSWIYAFAMSLVLIVIGLRLLKWYHRDLLQA
ncbi:MAG: ABC transporter permease [Pseudomonadota bacterium]